MTASQPRPLRLLVVADDLLARAGLAAVLGAQPGCEVVGQVSGGASMVPEVEVYRPDVVVWDLGWDPAPAIARLPDLRDAGVPVAVLLPDESQGGAAWAAGARCLLLRDSPGDDLVAALRAVARGLAVLDPVFAPPSGEGAAPAERPTPLPEPMTPRELEVLRLLADGLPNKAIAARLGVSEHTVKFHINAILGKLDAQSRTEAVVQAARLGLIAL